MNLARAQLAAGCLFAGCIALSTIHPWGDPRRGASSHAPILEGSTAPENVRAILAAKCGDCHSETARYPLYAHFAPVSWMIERDIHEGRKSLDMSQWQSINNESRISVLTRMASVVRIGEMPPRAYVMLHSGARLSPDEQQQIYSWAKAERKRLRQQPDQALDQSSRQSGTEKP